MEAVEVDEPGAQARRRWSAHAERFAPIVLAVLALLVWAVPLLGPVGFSYDDKEAIVSNPVVTGALPPRTAFTRDYWHHLEDAGHYRPLATLLLRADHAWARGPHPPTFRWTNVLLHALIVGLLAAAWRRFALLHRLPFPWFGLAVLAVHPACADVVAWISGRTSLVSGLGAAVGLLGLSLATRDRAVMVVCFLASLLSLLGKEDGVVVAALLPLSATVLMAAPADARSRARRALWAIGGSIAAVGLYAALRTFALGAALPSSPSAPLAQVAVLERVWIGMGAWTHGFIEFACFWNPAPPTLPASALQPSALLVLASLFGVLVLTATLVLSRGRAAEVALLGLGSVLVCILPLVQIVPAGELFAPRFLYQPMIFGAFLLQWLASACRRRLGSWNPWIQGGLIVGMYTVSILQAGPRYADRLSYWESHLAYETQDPRIWNAVGQARQEDLDMAGALSAYTEAARLDPDYGAPWSKVGELRANDGDLVGAVDAFREAILRDPAAVIARANLAAVLLRLDRPAEALSTYEDAISLAPGLAALHRGAARALFQLGLDEPAEAAAREALRLDPLDDAALRLLRSIEGR
ncbi:MAG: tetratricopeptide repeat protein [Planctomycetota bacterium]|nr:tetratricopeptide repeat protein [Planctomycetota bacterium]